MADFNPDTYLAQAKSQQFNPDTYLKQVQVTKQAQNPQQLPDAADKASQGNNPQAKSISLVNNAQFPSSYNGGGMTAGAAQAAPETNKAFAKIGTGLALGGLGGAATEGMAGLSGLLGRAGANAAGGGLQQYFSNLVDGKPASQDVGLAAGVGGVGSAALEGLGSVAGKGADNLMQWSAGMRKNIPGVGTSLIDQGVWGTRSGMSNQIESKLPQEESKLQDLVQSLKGSVSAKDLADAVAQQGEKFQTPGSRMTLQALQPDLDKINQAAGQFDPSRIGASGPVDQLSMSDLLGLKRQGDKLAYNASGNAATSTDADIGGAIADKARQLLSDSSGGETSETLGRERALILAKKSLDKPETIHQGLGSAMFFSALPGARLGGSTAAQLLQKGVASPATSAASPEVLQGLFGIKNAGSQN